METPITAILAHKGSNVATITPGSSLAEAASRMTEANIGALVVSSDGSTIEGVLSERDVVRRLARDGARALEVSVRAAMSAPVTTCGPTATVGELMATMTAERIRHVPVEVDGRLAGFVSIGDVVKERIATLEEETDQLQAYVSGRY